MRILHCIRGLANSSGTTHIVGPLAEAQARLGHEVEIFYVTKPNAPSVIPDRALVTSREFPMTWKTRQLGWSEAFRKEMRKRVHEFDVVHIHAIWNYVTWMAMREAQRAGVPYVVAPQGSLETWALGRSSKLKSLYGLLGERRLYDEAAAMQALTETESRQCREFGIKAPSAILPNGVDLQVVDAPEGELKLRERFGLSKESRVLLFLSRVFPKKGLDLLIPAFASVLKELPDWHLVIAGDDAGSGYRREMEELAHSNGGEGRIWFLGEVQGAEKFAALRDADAFTLSSYSEGLPVAVVEAMASRLPVLITPGCNIPEAESREAGWICKPTREAMERTLRSALADPAELKRRGGRARSLVEEVFNWPRIAERSIDIYQSFLRLAA